MGGTVVFVGAGATKSCGGPLTSEILPNIVKGTKTPPAPVLDAGDRLDLLGGFLTSQFHVTAVSPDEHYLRGNAAFFHMDWDDLQLNIPNPAVPAQFFISNVGGAISKGLEIELGARAAPGVDVFANVGYTHARFGAGSVSSGINVEGNKIPSTPDYTTSAGIQYSRAIGKATVHARADAVFYGSFEYNDANSLGQDAYSLVNFLLLTFALALYERRRIRDVADELWLGDIQIYPFALMGVLLGTLYVGLGPWVIPLFVAPILIARHAFAAKGDVMDRHVGAAHGDRFA